MITEPLDFKRVLQLLVRHKFVVMAAAVLGLVGGAAFVLLRPPMPTSQAWVVLQPTVHGGVGTQLLIARSDAVVKRAAHGLHPPLSPNELEKRVGVQSGGGSIMVVTARGQSATEAEAIANALAESYVDYVGTRGNLPDGPVQAKVLQPASVAVAPKQAPRLIGISLLGGLVAAALAALCVLAASRRDRRLRERDEIADSIGVPVLASINVDHPSDAAGWRKLLQEYRPGAVDAWRMRKVVQYLGLSDLGAGGQQAAGLTVTVVSASFDRRALALGPQLAVFAASRGIATALVVGPQQDVASTATLRAACAAPDSLPTDQLRLVVDDEPDAVAEIVDAELTVVVTVVDGQAPHVTHLAGATAMLLGVSAGMATAEQLARVAASAALGNHDIIGILVADPDPADTTTGRLPQVARPGHSRRPTRMTGTTTGTR